MKALRVSSFIVAFWLMASCAFAISLADVSVSSGVKQPNTHAHITASPSCIVYGMSVIGTANGGYVQLVQSASDPALKATSSVDIGQHIVIDAVQTGVNKILMHIQIGTANNTNSVSIPQGVACAGKLFIDCMNASAEVYYKE